MSKLPKFSPKAFVSSVSEKLNNNQSLWKAIACFALVIIVLEIILMFKSPQAQSFLQKKGIISKSTSLPKDARQEPPSNQSVADGEDIESLYKIKETAMNEFMDLLETYADLGQDQSWLVKAKYEKAKSIIDSQLSILESIPEPPELKNAYQKLLKAEYKFLVQIKGNVESMETLNAIAEDETLVSIMGEIIEASQGFLNILYPDNSKGSTSPPSSKPTPKALQKKQSKYASILTTAKGCVIGASPCNEKMFDWSRLTQIVVAEESLLYKKIYRVYFEVETEPPPADRPGIIQPDKSTRIDIEAETGKVIGEEQGWDPAHAAPGEGETIPRSDWP